MKLLILISCAFVLAPSAFASKIIGNGGNVVVCNETTPMGGINIASRATELLDFYEAEELYDPPLRIQDPGGSTYQEKFHLMMSRVRLRFPQLAAAIEVEFDNFEKHQSQKAKVSLESTVDSYNTVLPIGCYIAQIAIQIPTLRPEFPRQPWFIISKDLWDSLSELNKAGLALHEALYRIAARNGAEHSRGVRYIVGLMFSADMESISDEDWISGFLGARMRTYELNGVSIPLFTGNFAPCQLEPGETTCQKIEDLRPAQFTYNNGALTEVTYDREQRLQFTAARGTTVGLTVTSIKFIRTRYSQELSGQGIMDLSSDAGSGLGPVQLQFEGRVQPKESHFMGRISDRDFTDDMDSKMVPSSGGFYDLLSTAVLAKTQYLPSAR